MAGQLVRRHERIGNAGKRLVVLAHEFGALVGIDDVRVLEVGGGAACGNPVLLAISLHQVVVHVRTHNDAEVGVESPRSRRPHEVTKVLELGFVGVNRENQREGRVLTVLIALVGFEVRKPWKRVKRKRLRFHFRAEQACSLLQLTIVRKARCKSTEPRVAKICLHIFMTEAKKLALAHRLFFLYFTKHSISFSLRIVINVNLR